MDYTPEDKLAIYAAATRGLMELEPDLDSLEHWADAILSAESPDELFK